MAVSKLGYTATQAERLKRQLDHDVARIEDIVSTMRRRVTDLSASLPHDFDNLLEDLRENVYALHKVVERRTSTRAGK